MQDYFRSNLACKIALEATSTVAMEENGRKEIDIKRYAKVEKVCCYLVPLKPDVPFSGPRQTVQTQIRRLRMRHLVRVYTVCSQEFPMKMK